MTFEDNIKLILRRLNGRPFSGDQSIDKAALSDRGNIMFFYELHKRLGCFPYSHFEDKDTADITYNTLEKHYVDSVV